MSEKQKIVPKLRFPEFREAGEWEEKRLGDVGSVRMCKRILKEQTSPRGDIPFYKIGTFGGVPDAYISREIFENFRNNYPFPKNGAVLISAAGTIGRTVRYNGELAYFQDSNIVWLDNSEKLISDNFLFYLYQLIDWSPSVGAIQRLYNENILGAQVKFPSVPEQQKIADCLASLDELLTLETQQLDTLKTHKKGLMQGLFPSSGGVPEGRGGEHAEATTPRLRRTPPKEGNYPRLRFPEFRDAGEWEISPLSKYVSSLDAGVSVVSGDRPARGGEVGILKTSAVTDGVFNPQENKLVFDKGELQRVKEPVTANSIIISRMNTPALVGANAYVSDSLENIFLPDRLWAAKPKRNTSMRFIAFVLGSEKGRAALSELATGTSGSMKNITKPAVLALEITAPSFAEQQKIADCLTSLDDLITTQTQKLAALKNHKKGLMQQLFPDTATTPPLRGTPPEEGNKSSRASNSPPVEGWTAKLDGVVNMKSKPDGVVK